MTIFPDAIPTYDDDGIVTQWVIVAADPHDVTYFDDDAQAMDETNYDAFVAGLDTDSEHPWAAPIYRYRGLSERDAVDPDPFVMDAGDWWQGSDLDGFPWDYRGQREWSTSQTVIAVRTYTAAHEHWQHCSRVLSDYPLLDEDAYSAREWEEWERYWADTARKDVARDAADAVNVDTVSARWLAAIPAAYIPWNGDRAEAFADTLSDLLTDTETFDLDHGWENVAGNAASYYYGFSGEYDAAGMRDAVADDVALTLAAVERVFGAMVLVGQRVAGIFPLPFGATL